MPCLPAGTAALHASTPARRQPEKGREALRGTTEGAADGAVTAQVFSNGVLGSGQASTAPARGGTPDIACTVARVEKAR